MKIRNGHQNSLEAPYFFLVYTFGLEDEVGNICGYLLIVIADGLMVSVHTSQVNYYRLNRA